MKELQNERTFSALRSLVRYHKMLAKEAPSILIEMENSILKDRFNSLSSEEIYYVVTIWPAFCKDQVVLDELQDEACANDLSNYFRKLN